MLTLPNSSSPETAACLVVTGMHRSGTSLTTSLLQNAGLHVGCSLMAETRHNQKRHFENLEFYRFQQAVLRSQGLSEEGWVLQEAISVEEPYLSEARQ